MSTTRSPRAWAGVDLGTSSLKVVAVDERGRTVSEAEAPFDVRAPGPGRAEGDPAQWLDAVTGALERLTGSLDLRAVGLAGQMHGTVLVDGAGEVVRPPVLWPDARAADLRSRWEERLSPAELGRLGGPWSPGMTGPVLAWLAEHEPAGVAAAHAVLLPKDHVRDRLVGGSVATDPSDASGTLLWDHGAGSWLSDVERLVPARLLPPVRPSAETAGEWRGVPVCTGGGDTPVSLLALREAVGGFADGDLVVNLGSGVQVIDPRPRPRPVPGWPSRHVYADADGGEYAMVAAQNGGLALTWAAERLGLSWDALLAAADTAPPGADGVGLSPFLAPERGELRSDREAGWFGRHGDSPPTPVAARAALEAQAFVVRRCRDLVAPGGPGGSGRLLLVGGGARDPRVRRLLADVLGAPVHYLAVRSAAALGAALLAGAPPPPRAPLTTTEPSVHRDLDPDLEQAYAAWRTHCYG